MNLHKHILVSAAALVVVTLAASHTADAGRGGSFAKIRSAAEHGNPDAIVAELERAENIPCTTECMSFVMGLLDHESYYVRDGAAWWFARRPAQKKEVAERALALLATGNTAEVRNAADALGRVGHPSMIADLGSVLARDVGAEAKVSVVRAIGMIAHISGRVPLEQAMADGDAQVRRQAIVSWGKLLRQTDADPVAPLVVDGDVTVRRAAAQMVGTFRTQAARANLEQIVVSDPDPAVRRNAAWALGRIGDAASRDALTQATTDESSLVRMTAKAALRAVR